MSQERTNVRALPRFVIKKNNLIKPTSSATVNSGLLKNLSLTKTLYAEDLLYESKNGDFLKLDGARVSLYNKINLVTSSSLTIAKYFNDNQTTVEKTSENVAKLIGQCNYDLVYLAISSLEDEAIKVKALVSLLTVPKKSESVSCQTDLSDKYNKISVTVETSCQTEETCIDFFMKKNKHRRRVRKQMTPYVVTEEPKEKHLTKYVINPDEFQNFSRAFDYPINKVKVEVQPVKGTELPLLNFDEDSMESTGKLSTITCNTIPELMNNPLSIIENIDKVTQPVTTISDASIKSNITLLDNTVIEIPCKIEDKFHIATPDIMKHIQPEQRRKVLWYQAYIDWKYCLTRDSNNYLPLHVAAMNGDVEFLKRQCIVLKSKQESVDIPTCDNTTALQMSVAGESPQCTAMLLQFGADPLVTNEEYSNCYHMAAESTWGHLKPLLDRAANEPLQILQQNDELWAQELDRPKSKEYLAKYLLNKICALTDGAGYTPLMLASKLGLYENVKLLLKASPSSINSQMPNGGNTALYTAVSAACLDCYNRGNKSKLSENFQKTIELLVEQGADPNIYNDSSMNTNTLLTDINIPELSMLVANKLTSINCFGGERSTPKSETIMLIKENDGTVNIKDIKKEQKLKSKVIKPKTDDKNKKAKEKPIILENIKIDKPVKHKLTNASETTDESKKIKFDNQIVKTQHRLDFLNNFKRFVEKSTIDGGSSNAVIKFESDNLKPSTSNNIILNAKELKLSKSMNEATKKIVVLENTIQTTKIEVIPIEVVRPQNKNVNEDLVKVDPRKRLKIDKNKGKLDTT